MPIGHGLSLEGTLQSACQVALTALQMKEDPLPEQRTWAEIPFGRELGGTGAGKILGIRFRPVMSPSWASGSTEG